jgi:hypothetical protein
MKKIIFALLVVLVATSCNKWKKDKYDLTYYCADYKETDMFILDQHTSDIDALWVEFYSKGEDKQYDSYTLVVKSNGEFFKESGACQIDWEEQLNFMPQTGDSYIGDWLYEKEKYTITHELKTRTEVLTFVYKETDKCKKGK